MRTSMRYVFVVAAMWSLSCHAATTDFSDLTVGAGFVVGDTVTTNGLEFTVRAIASPLGGSGLIVANAAEFGNYLATLGNSSTGLEFVLEQPVSMISLDLQSGGGARSFLINGVQYTNSSFALFDGQTLSGVNISASIEPVFGQAERGSIILTGPIDSFTSFIGFESAFFAIAVTVPEPSAGLLTVLSASLAILRRRRRQRR